MNIMNCIVFFIALYIFFVFREHVPELLHLLVERNDNGNVVVFMQGFFKSHISDFNYCKDTQYF